jgi:hypothetical protein
MSRLPSRSDTIADIGWSEIEPTPDLAPAFLWFAGACLIQRSAVPGQHQR